MAEGWHCVKLLSVWITSSLATALTPTAVALGNFDGVHRGHRQVIQPVLLQSADKGDRAFSTVLTFDPHPKEFFTGQLRPLLTPLPEKVWQLKQLGVDQLVLLPFNQKLADLSPAQFVEEVLGKLQAKQISVGDDFCFGKQRSGSALDLRTIAASYGINVTIVPLKRLAGERISSSAIRQALQTGKLEIANHLLGRAYTLLGQVTQGQQLGRTIGFPTANLHLAPQKFLPMTGVYAVQVQIFAEPEATIAQFLPGVMNLGYRPTVDGTRQTIEVHLLDWSGDLYGKTLLVHLEQFLRPEQKFDSLDALKAQIQVDCDRARSLFDGY